MIKFCNEGVDYLEIKNQRLGGVILTMKNLSSHENLLHINKSWITVFQCDTLYMKTKVLYASIDQCLCFDIV